jgi:hypothetical protein
MTMMTDAPLDRPSPREVFALRAWARARLYFAGEITLHDGVDVLQDDAEASALVDAIGMDSVQQIIAEAFGSGRS